MTHTLISLISIIVGIIGANVAGLILKKYTLGITGNTIAGVFGSVLLIKSFGRLGFNPNAIMNLGSINFNLLSINILVSFLGGVIAVILIQKLKARMNKE